MDASSPDRVVGAALGVYFPTNIAPLMSMGPAFLTEAFHATGALPKTNRVIAITQSKEFFGGGMGRKLCLNVAYAHPDPALASELFVKFPRDFGDPLRDLFGPLMEPETRFALLSRSADFPIAVPACYFADYDPNTKSGLLITERIRYGEGAIEPCHEKCLDYEIPDALAHYQALTHTMARLAAHQMAGRFGDDFPRMFPFDPEAVDAGARIPHNPAQLDEKLAALRAFAKKAPHLFQGGLNDASFLSAFAAGARTVLSREAAIRATLNHAADYIALCHWNMNLDNAWFERLPGGQLSAGLLDWGSVAQMNVAQAFYGMTCACEIDLLNANRRALLAQFVDDVGSHGGARLDVARLEYFYKLSVAVLGIAWILDAPSLIAAEIPAYAGLSGRADPKLREKFLARAQLQLLMVFLNEWRDLDITAALNNEELGTP